MTFSVKYRTSLGSIAERQIIAKNRTECFILLKDSRIDIISVISIDDKKKSVNSCLQRVSFWKLIGLVSITFLLVLIMLQFRHGTKKIINVSDNKHSGRMKIKTAESIVQPHRSNATPIAPSSTSESIISNTTESFKRPSRHPPDHPAVTNARKKVIFKTGVEQVMGLIFNTEPGDPPPFLPSISPSDSENLAAILLSKNDNDINDSDDIKHRKEIVQIVKKELLQYLKDGGKPSDFLGYYHAQLRKAFIERQEAQKLVIQSLREDPEMGTVLANEINSRFSEKGIKGVYIPPKYRQGNGNE